MNGLHHLQAINVLTRNTRLTTLLRCEILHIVFENNVLETENESFPTMHNIYGLEYKSFVKHKEISEKITNFGQNLVQKKSKPCSNTRLLEP